MKLMDFLLDLLFPKHCLNCDKTGYLVCDKCLKTIDFIKKQRCPNCKRVTLDGNFCSEKCSQNFYFNQLIVCLKYDKNSLIRKIILTFKHKFSEELKTILGEILKTQLIYFSQYCNFFKDAVFVPVPLYKKRLKYRGFNQAELISEYLVDALKKSSDYFKNIEMCDCLLRVKQTKIQSKSVREERLKNPIDSFVLKENFYELLKDKVVILIDDVATTCSTLNECGKVLKKSGASFVCALVVARG